ncbi:endonuclease [candidate division WOR-1 bacterium RIFOXYB2_FULL_42_35]|uniref:Endonuclease n=1 Tax=candidate division WOR-1 bacterium RIFOXYC2_FULL_41_25 TaxID=1802586 RepID=A0A1F4TJ39_UNCSA|nr:MAG: endonuclease [candidate division WOR-1 bacterium RIFOXYA2_FULL_41_14]OGC21806.1 MAG: endonuclease [candidate division WOR-1 bacterium RIFOXYB2_FULL_42_35]OGC32704.1 MAG: endonuclease [candidate division WOR-1 bacterium RIFOXYC2_FULL_41_25]OGC42577.1 MAG: endonuclease [candidate division WOR-1 bacterium RIFOXYD2_FULL_41_8]
MHTVYVLRSLKVKKSYVGMSIDLERRLKEHNSGKNLYTSRYLPWEIIYVEQYESKEEAVKREKFLKTSSGRRFLKKVFSKMSS